MTANLRLRLGSVLLAVAASTVLTGVASADIAFNPSGGTQSAGFGNDGLFFTVGASNLQLTSMGVFNGADSIRTVGIFLASGGNFVGAPLALANVATDSSGNGWSYVDVSGLGVELQANTQYVIVSTSTGGFQYTADNANVGLGAGIASFDGYKYNDAGAFDPNMVTAYAPAYFGPNLQYSVVPAPASAAVFGVGLLASSRRRRV
ncbi:MAG: hypothetical protein QM783_07410 [Phycisphaerales bacterium]